MSDFAAPVDIGNRALQHCGATRIATTDFSEKSKNCAETSFVYDKIRKAELQRRYWTFAIKRTVLRAIDQNTMLLAPAMWMSTTKYFVGSIVADETGAWWISNTPDNLANDPLLTTFWEPYFGPRGVPLYDASGTTAYNAGELVYTAVGDGTNRVYLSLQSDNSDVPSAPTAFDPTVTYFRDQVVTSSSVAYMSLVDLNIGNTPATSPTQWTTSFVGGSGSDKWLQIGGAEFPSGVGLTTLNIVYPIGTGPSDQLATDNVFLLPSGYLRLAPQNPKPGLGALGGPADTGYNDWLIESGYLISSISTPITLRFVANMTDVTKMHTMFCEGVALRIGIEICEIITQSSQKLLTIGKLYDRWMTEAGQVDAIEQGFDEPPEDDLISVRC